MITLNAEMRDVKVNPKMIRKGGNIPAVFYGPKHPSTSISVARLPFGKAHQEAGESSIISLKTPTEALDAIIHDVDLDPVTGEPIHIDFYIVSKDQKIEVDIPVEFVGIAPAEKLGGIVMRIMHEIRVEALPGKLPQHLTVDLGKLVALDSHITVGDIALGDGVRSLVPLTELIAGVTLPQEEKDEYKPTIDMSAIEVEKKGKKEGEGEEGAEQAA